jgi:uncharacterized membrane protein YccC
MELRTAVRSAGNPERFDDDRDDHAFAGFCRRSGERPALLKATQACHTPMLDSMTYTLRSLAQADPGTRPCGPKRERIGLRNRLRDFAKGAMPTFDRQVFGAVIFSAKTFAAALLALFISFWLALDEPYWAIMTVFVVAQPDSGLVLAKGFYRLLGTAVGLLVTTALVFGLAQYGELFIASLAVWIGLCSFAARGRRGFASYSFQLAGYTAAIVGIPAALNTDGAYTVIVARATEITLGIVCMGVVSRLIFPGELAPKLIALAGQAFQRVGRFAELALDPASSPEQLASEREALAKDFGAVETTRSSAFFESAEARRMDWPLRDAVHAAVDLCAIAEAVAARPNPDLEDSPNRVSSIPNADRAPPKTIFALRRAAAARDLTRARDRLDQRVAALAEGDTLSKPPPPAPLWSDPLTAVLTGIRAALAVTITAAFWFVTAWPSGPIAVIVAGVVCTLLAPTPEPVKITAAAAATIVVFAVPLFLTQLCLLPYASDFFSMAVLLAPYLLMCAFIIAQPGLGPLGLLAAVYLAVSSHIDNNNVVTYDPTAFFNTSLAIVLGISAGVVMFAIFFPETPQWAARRFFRQVGVHLSQLAATRRPAFSAFDFALCEQFASTLERLKDEPALARDCLVRGAIGLSSAWAIERLAIGVDANRQTAGISGLLAGLSRVYLRPSWARLTRTAWDGRVVSRRLLAKARAADKPTDSEALLVLAVACEALRSNLLRNRLFVREEQYAVRS